MGLKTKIALAAAKFAVKSTVGKITKVSKDAAEKAVKVAKKPVK